ncbi:hypothetical protein T492DRAFT_864464, partial [Pavlovales sp. CCMP2436]
SFHRASALRPAPCTRKLRLQRYVFGFLIIHHFYQLPTSASRAGTLAAVVLGKRTLNRVAGFEAIAQNISVTFHDSSKSLSSATWAAVLIFGLIGLAAVLIFGLIGLAYTASVYNTIFPRVPPSSAIPSAPCMATKTTQAATTPARAGELPAAASPGTTSEAPTELHRETDPAGKIPAGARHKTSGDAPVHIRTQPSALLGAALLGAALESVDGLRLGPFGSLFNYSFLRAPARRSAPPRGGPRSARDAELDAECG